MVGKIQIFCFLRSCLVVWPTVPTMHLCNVEVVKGLSGDQLAGNNFTENSIKSHNSVEMVH